MDRRPIRPDRVRRVQRGFAAVPNRFLHGGFFASLGQVDRSLYFFLVLAADRHGVSFYGYDKICAALAIRPDEYVQARDRLVDADLVAFEAGRFQVLSLPDRPRAITTTATPRRPPPPATTRSRPPGRHQDAARIDAIIRTLKMR